MPGTLNVGGHNIITHSGTSGAGTVDADNIDTVNIGNNALVVDSSGNVGIGTGSPTTDANGEANNLVIGSTGTTRNGLTVLGSEVSTLAFGDSADDNVGRLTYNHTSDLMQFHVSDTERMRIDSGGNVLVGINDIADISTTSGNSISAGGGVQVTRSSGYPCIYLRKVNNFQGDIVQFLYNGNTDVGSINITSSSTSYTTSSDYRLKENITEITDGITRIKQLNPSRFNFITDPDNTVDGFIAHEVSDIVPEAVSGEKDAVDKEGNIAPQGIDQSKLVPLLTAALQESIALIESQQSQIDALTAKTQEQDLTIASLISRIEALENA